MARSLAEAVGKGLISTSKLSIPELGALIQHLNLLYVQMKSKKGIVDDDPDIIDILGKPHIQTRGWYNQGHSAVTESA